MKTLLALVCGVLVAATAAAQSFPKPTGRVNDFAGVIDPAVEAELDRRLDELETKTSHEIAVATVASLDGMTIDDYANRLFKAWGIGQAQQDNGVLVLVAPNEREIKIEVGYGLEGILPDGLAGQVIRESFIPRFQADDYSGGIRDGVSRVADIVEKQQLMTPEEIDRLNSGADDIPVWIILPFFGLFVTIGSTMVGLGIRSKTGFPLIFGSLFGGMPLLMGLALAFTAASLTLVPLALVMSIVGYRLGGRASWRDAFRDAGGKGKGGSSGGWMMGGGSGGSSSGSSSSGSSSSFGGGSSGGGGASGKW